MSHDRGNIGAGQRKAKGRCRHLLSGWRCKAGAGILALVPGGHAPAGGHPGGDGKILNIILDLVEAAREAEAENPVGRFQVLPPAAAEDVAALIERDESQEDP